MKKILCSILALALVSCTFCGCEKNTEDVQSSDINIVADKDVTPNDSSEFVFGEKDGGIIIKGYKGNSVTVNIPPEINGKPVTAIGEYAFDGFEENDGSVQNGKSYKDNNINTITSIHIPGSVKTIEKGAFANENSQHKALAVLTYAAFGNYAEPPKDAAVMNLLCNLPVTPVLYADELPKVSDSEKELVDSLLQAVVANWKAVGHMSPDGLRGTYFVRNGTVETSGMTDMLTVETKTYDILLDKLPWGYSMIKHPWMKKVLNVKWR